ncbi:DUF397 domain-containing protein [Streptosporangium sp. NPDC005286]|uniref:DUF397 domain-containing protein n=1 Tax=Streptosporangium sp. NPDC005286 TaxID=3154463 RepID=UPI0033A8427C
MDQELSEATWVKSPFSGDNGGECVEVAKLPGGRVGVRDSKDRSGPAPVFTPAEWAAFTRWVRTDDTV